jgi:hypothetical protein
LVTVLPWIEFDADSDMQVLAFAHAIANHGKCWQWMAFIDIDEFLFPVSGSSLVETLCEFEHLPAIAVPWTMFDDAILRFVPAMRELVKKSELSRTVQEI